MNNDIYLEIIKHSDISQYKTLKQINKFFKYYTKKFFFKHKVFKKHLKNIKCNLLYQSNNPLKLFCNNLNFSFNNTYTLNDFLNYLINTNINKLVLPSQLIKSNFDNNYTHEVGRHGDIVQSFTICGENIKKVELYIGGILVWKSWYLDANLINIQPFFNGIFLIKLAFHNVKIKVYAEKCNHIYTYYKFLQNGRRDLATTDITLPHVFYNNKQLYNTITYQNGMISLN